MNSSDIQSLIEPGKPFILHNGYPSQRIQLCKDAISNKKLHCALQCACNCKWSEEDFKKKWIKLFDLSVKNSVFLITDISAFSNSQLWGKSSLDLSLRMIKLLCRNKKRRVILTGNILPEEIKNLSYNIIKYE